MSHIQEAKGQELNYIGNAQLALGHNVKELLRSGHRINATEGTDVHRNIFVYQKSNRIHVARNILRALQKLRGQAANVEFNSRCSLDYLISIGIL